MPLSILLKIKIMFPFLNFVFQGNDSTCYKEIVAAFMIGHSISCSAFSFHGNWHTVKIPTEHEYIDNSITALLLNPDKSFRASGQEAFFQMETTNLEDCYFIPKMTNVFDSEKVSFISVISAR